ncbi:hypothetical protein WR25_04407 [Diploscapter pachys]|uniref:SWI/SNF-related matrix-associated actin-dependent regulator of chromatin subfamily A-like protein 1 n=1 Tax=Diploscapter pachys TaxID=2018661 RepID=A0A2A2J855_9BILA|nr:hypothetical protein WR25_04407 [Diploscapter pachys]
MIIQSHSFRQTSSFQTAVNCMKRNSVPFRQKRTISATVSFPPKTAIDTVANFKLNSVPDDLIKMIPETQLNMLFPYQKEGVRFVLERGGRAIIADEMGLGKSVQALVSAYCYRNEWPLLIVCPSSVKSAWEIQISTFLPSVQNVVMIDKGTDLLPLSNAVDTIVIISYDLMTNKKLELIATKYNVIIFDESHMLKAGSSQRTKAATAISKVAKRVILLSGTPALSRPSELFSQVRLVDKKLFPNFRKFAYKYCDGKMGQFTFEAKGCKNSGELKAILMKRIMIRRLKANVLKDLPAKRRKIIYLSGKAIDYRMEALRRAKLEYEKHNEGGTNDNSAIFEGEGNNSLIEYYRETGVAKAAAVCSYITETYFSDERETRKLLIFAHHKVVMDAIQTEICNKGLRWIRIDGSTPNKDRGPLCKEFQTDPAVRVAILSISAAGVGITLTAASVVIFAELHFNPGFIVQAEDRAHRVGQKDSVYVQILLAKNTADDPIWDLVDLSSDSFKESDEMHKNVGPTQTQDIRRFMTSTSSSSFSPSAMPSPTCIPMITLGSDSSGREPTQEMQGNGKEGKEVDEFDDEPVVILKKRRTTNGEPDDWDEEPVRKRHTNLQSS